MTNKKTYLGDGVYIRWTGYNFEMTTEDGISVTNRIYLEPEVVEALKLYLNPLTVFAQSAETEEGVEGV